MKRATVTLDSALAFHSGEDRHPQVVVREFAHRNGLRVIDATYTDKDDRWTFEVESDDDHLPLPPAYIHAVPHR